MSKAAKALKSVVSGVGSLMDKSAHPLSTIKKLTSKVVDPVTHMMNPKVPGQADAPLMPDYEGIDKARRRARSSKMGRVDTIMTADTLG